MRDLSLTLNALTTCVARNGNAVVDASHVALRAARGSAALVTRAAALAAICATGAIAAEATPVPDTYTAVTTAMDPSGVELRIAVREWSDDAARAAVVEALSADANAGDALKDLPTAGYLWQSGRAAGHTVKYAHRVSDERGERVTFVTDKPIDSYAFKPWAIEADVSAHDYSVVELYLDGTGTGTGTLSLAADVALDEAQNLVSLAPKPGAPAVLTNAKLEPKPYWAK
jgi:hypothetical protein